MLLKEARKKYYASFKRATAHTWGLNPDPKLQHLITKRNVYHKLELKLIRLLNQRSLKKLHSLKFVMLEVMEHETNSNVKIHSKHTNGTHLMYSVFLEIKQWITSSAPVDKKPKFNPPKLKQTPRKVAVARNVVKKTLGLKKVKTKTAGNFSSKLGCEYLVSVNSLHLFNKFCFWFLATVSTSGIKMETNSNNDEWTIDLRRQLLQRFLSIRLGEPVRNYWSVIAKDFPGFTKEQVKEKVKFVINNVSLFIFLNKK